MKPIIAEFVGGPLDGSTLRTELSLCQGYLVAERRETELEIFVTFKSDPSPDYFFLTHSNGVKQ